MSTGISAELPLRTGSVSIGCINWSKSDPVRMPGSMKSRPSCDARADTVESSRLGSAHRAWMRASVLEGVGLGVRRDAMGRGRVEVGGCWGGSEEDATVVPWGVTAGKGEIETGGGILSTAGVTVATGVPCNRVRSCTSPRTCSTAAVGCASFSGLLVVSGRATLLARSRGGGGSLPAWTRGGGGYRRLWLKSVEGDLTVLSTVGVEEMVTSECTDIRVRAGIGRWGVLGVRRGGAGFFAGGGREVGVSGLFRFSWVLAVGGMGALLEIGATGRGAATGVGPVTETVLEDPVAGVATTTRGVGFSKGTVEGRSIVLESEVAAVAEVAVGVDVSELRVDVLVSILGGIWTGEDKVEGWDSTGDACLPSTCSLETPCSLSDGGHTSSNISTRFST